MVSLRAEIRPPRRILQTFFNPPIHNPNPPILHHSIPVPSRFRHPNTPPLHFLPIRVHRCSSVVKVSPLRDFMASLLKKIDVGKGGKCREMVRKGGKTTP